MTRTMDGTIAPPAPRTRSANPEEKKEIAGALNVPGTEYGRCPGISRRRPNARRDSPVDC